MEELARGAADEAPTKSPGRGKEVRVELLHVDGEDHEERDEQELGAERIHLKRTGTGAERAHARRPRAFAACCGAPSESGAAEEPGGSSCHPEEKKQACRGLGLLYTLLASTIFSVVGFLVKKIDGVHAVEISAIRCFFQMIFTLPALIYYKVDIFGVIDLRGCQCLLKKSKNY